MKVLWDFNETKEPLATGGITMYPTGTGSGLAVESDLSSFDADTKPHQRFGEMWGIGRWPFRPHSMRHSWDAPNVPGKSKQAVPQGGGNMLLQIPGFRLFFFFLIKDFIHLFKSHCIQIRPREPPQRFDPLYAEMWGANPANRAEQTVCSSIRAPT